MSMTACLLQGIPVAVAEHARDLARRERCSINAALLAMLAHAVSCSGASTAGVADADADWNTDPDASTDASCDAISAGTVTGVPGTTAEAEPDPSTACSACADVAVPLPPEPPPMHAPDGAANDVPETLAPAQSTGGGNALSSDDGETVSAATVMDDASARGWAMPEDSSLEAAEARALREALMAARSVPCG